MATMRDIRRRIKTIRNIQQITKALKMVAAARLQRAQNRAAAARPYTKQMRAMVNDLTGGGSEVRQPLMEVRDPAHIGVLVISSDRGMAGSYNANVIRRANEVIGPYEKNQVKVITVGRRAKAFFARRGYEIVADFPMPSAEVTFYEAKEISGCACRIFRERQVDQVFLIYTRFFSAVKQQTTILRLLPVSAPEGTGAVREIEEYIFEPSAEELLGNLIPRYVNTQVYGAMMESLASEHGARMTAMSSATDSAGDMIDGLTLDFNRARQEAITRELAEIVGGAEALK